VACYNPKGQLPNKQSHILDCQRPVGSRQSGKGYSTFKSPVYPDEDSKPLTRFHGSAGHVQERQPRSLRQFSHQGRTNNTQADLRSVIEPLAKAPYGYRNAVGPSDMGNLSMALDFTNNYAVNPPKPPGFLLHNRPSSPHYHTHFLPLSRRSTIMGSSMGRAGDLKDISQFRESKHQTFLSKVFQALGIGNALSQREHETFTA